RRWLCPRMSGRGYHSVFAALGSRKQRLAIFRPGIIAGNAHTPRYVARLGRLIPGRFGTIEQDDIARAFVAEFINSSPNGFVYFENAAMRQRSRALDSSQFV